MVIPTAFESNPVAVPDKIGSPAAVSAKAGAAKVTPATNTPAATAVDFDFFPDLAVSGTALNTPETRQRTTLKT